MIHPRVESSFQFHPNMRVWISYSGVEAYADPDNLMEGVTVLEFLKGYDWKGSNEFQEQENLEFLRMYLDRYPAIRHHFD